VFSREETYRSRKGETTWHCERHGNRTEWGLFPSLPRVATGGGTQESVIPTNTGEGNLEKIRDFLPHKKRSAAGEICRVARGKAVTSCAVVRKFIEKAPRGRR